MTPALTDCTDHTLTPQDFSQKHQGSILHELMHRLQITEGTSLEVGAWNGVKGSNTRNLMLAGWQSFYIEADPTKYKGLLNNTKDFPTARTVNMALTCEPGSTLDDALDAMGAPYELDLLCIDIDSIDYWVWRSLSRHTAKVVMIEYNAHFEPELLRTAEYTVAYLPRQANTRYYGASAGALHHLAYMRNYDLVGVVPQLDLIFVRHDVREPFADLLPICPVPERADIIAFRGKEYQEMVDIMPVAQTPAESSSRPVI